MIIIKSQDGGLNIDVKGKLYVNKVEEMNGRGYEKWYQVKIRSGLSLGTYKTEERAKEVMEMIEEHITKLYINKTITADLTTFVSLEIREAYVLSVKDSAIFSMPKE